MRVERLCRAIHAPGIRAIAIPGFRRCRRKIGRRPAPERSCRRIRRTQVDYFTKEPAGTIVIDTPNTYLYLVLGNGKALRYGIGVGREGFTWTGAEKISRMAEWPDWNPPEQMIERQPYLPRFMAGGATNPLGARALYLGDTLYRIHGTNQPSTIGSFVSSGCIRLTNEDITDLYGRVKVGTRVVVLSGKERANTAAPIASPRAGSTARSSAPSDTNAAAKKRKPPKESEPQTTTGSARGETTEAHGNTPQTNGGTRRLRGVARWPRAEVMARKRRPEFHLAAKRSYFHVHRESMMRSRGAPKGDQAMEFREMRTAEHGQAVEELDQEIREIVRHEVLTNPGRQPENEGELGASKVYSLLQRVSATSLQEIDKLIAELESSRDMLQSEAARVQREIVQYSTLSQAARQSTKIITESLTQLKKVPDAPTLSD
jgi:L,D-transpeptidase catalytic domain